MPHIRMRGLPQQAVITISETLLEQLAQICNGNIDSFTLDWVPSISYRHGKADTRFVQVEVLWFPKDPDTHHLVEQAIREAVLSVYSQATHITVMFTTITPSSYYRDGHHF
ncbi:DUF1904 domain-containing protein [Shewanella sp. Isolate11]|uniref:DUF1904 domain-containing protein n=1 Tax=Shewanella sp. Isolate11 TaxID=2908530 RepID=UPI001EFDA930|nr:DUF1904 domain-containing protein [Shewanella sp. Isolate11]MCG9696694.1 DUF1904 domain-containing protein [Shewanella sp. Isolate11]